MTWTADAALGLASYRWTPFPDVCPEADVPYRSAATGTALSWTAHLGQSPEPDRLGRAHLPSENTPGPVASGSELDMSVRDF
jgi:hypothetical protein